MHKLDHGTIVNMNMKEEDIILEKKCIAYNPLYVNLYSYG